MYTYMKDLTCQPPLTKGSMIITIIAHEYDHQIHYLSVATG